MKNLRFISSTNVALMIIWALAAVHTAIILFGLFTDPEIKLQKEILMSKEKQISSHVITKSVFLFDTNNTVCNPVNHNLVARDETESKLDDIKR